MAISVRPAGANELEALVPLFVEMERLYHGDLAAPVALVRERLAAALGGQPKGLILAALEGPRALGFATLWEMFPGDGLRCVWYLKDLYVLEAERGRGIGTGLIRAAAREVIARGGLRIDFTTDVRNLAAQRLYDRLGAARIEKVFYRFALADLNALAESDGGDRHVSGAAASP